MFITNAIDNESLPLYGDGLQVRDWLYVTDHCSGIDVALHRGAAGGVYNLGGGNERTNIEVTELILQYVDKSRDLIVQVEDRPGHDQRYALDSNLLMSLGWSPSKTFEEALQSTTKWYQANEWWWRPIKGGEFKEYYLKQYGNRLQSRL